MNNENGYVSCYNVFYQHHVGVRSKEERKPKYLVTKDIGKA